MTPGELIVEKGEIICNADRPVTRLKVTNTGDRPVQVGSHCHFFETNRKMLFDRPQAFGLRLNIPAGTSVRFEPGEEKQVEPIPFGGARLIFGINTPAGGDIVLEGSKQGAVDRMKKNNFKTESA